MFLARNIAAGVATAIPALAVFGSLWVWRDSLPARVITQWAGGEASTSQPWFVFLLQTGGLATIGAGVGLWAAFSRRTDQRFRKRVFLVAGAFSAVLAVFWIALTGLSATSSSPDIGGWGLVALLAAGWGLVPFFISGSSRPSPPPASKTA